jgi:AraC-like DNA-binding protein
MSYIPHIDLVSSLILFGVLQAFCLAIIFFLNRGKAGNLAFAALMLLLAVIELESFLNYSGYIIFCPFMINVSPPLIFIMGPLSYLYLKQWRNETVTKSNAVIHFIPAIGYFSYSFLFFLQPTNFKINAVLRSFHPEAVWTKILPSFKIDPFNIQGIVVVEGLALHLLCYTIASIVSLRSQRIRLREIKSNVQWPFFWAFSMLIGSIIFLLTGGVVNGFVLYESVLPAYCIDLFSVVLVYTTTIFWISKMIVQKLPGDKYSKSGLSSEFQQLKLLQLREIMEKQKPYKSPDFSLSELARLSNISPHHASQVINSFAGITFNEFVNLYRVEEARNVLKSPESNLVKVELLAYELGYKSKSAFFNSFKRYTDTTPARFRDLVQKA